MHPSSLVLLAVVLSCTALTGCLQGDPGDDDFQQSCPAWIKGLSKMSVPFSWSSAKFLYTNQTTQPVFDDWDFAAPEYDSSGALVKEGTGFGDNLETFQDHPIDFLVFDFRADEDLAKTRQGMYVQDAELRMSFFASDSGAIGAPLEAWDQQRGRESTQHQWTFGLEPGKEFGMHNVTLRVDLAAPDQPADPRGVFVHWEWTFDLDHDRDTPSAVFLGYSPEMWYRTCNSDGSSA